MDTAADHSERDHAIYAPSSLKRTLMCAGSIGAINAMIAEGWTDVASAAGEEGTECHEAASNILEGMSWDKAVENLSEEQEWIVETYTEYAFGLIDKLIEQHGEDGVKVWIETRVRSGIPGLENNHGTADLIILAGRTLAVIDLKAGHKAVDVGTPENPLPQLANYGYLALDHFDLWGEVDTVRLTIVQPRCYDKPQTVVVKPSRLDKFADDVVFRIAQIEAGRNDRHAGEWCFFCPAKGRCPALRESAVTRAKTVFDDTGASVKPARNYAPEELADIAAEAAVIQAHIDGVFAHVKRELEKGRKIPGWKLVAKRAMSKWVDHDALVDAMAVKGIASKLAFKPKALTPLQLQTILKKEKIEFDLTDYFVKDSSGPTIAKADDPRPEIKFDPFKDKDDE